MHRELENLKMTSRSKIEARFTYYSKFDLCIDKFLNYKLEDQFLIQKLLERLMRRDSLLRCSQINPIEWVKLFSVSGIGESARGRILEHRKNIHF